MEEEAKKKLKKFIKPGTGEIPLGIILIILGLAAFAYEFLNDLLVLGIMWLGFAVAIGGALIGMGAVKKSNFKKKFAEFEKNGDIPDILEDFETGRKLFNDSLILGKYFIIIKKSGTVVEYSDVTKLYQLVKGSGEKGKRIIQVKTADKKKYELCRIPIKGKGSEDLGRALGYITAKNRNIQL